MKARLSLSIEALPPECFCYATTQLAAARQVQQERTQVVCSNKIAWKRLVRRRSRNGPKTLFVFEFARFNESLLSHRML